MSSPGSESDALPTLDLDARYRVDRDGVRHLGSTTELVRAFERTTNALRLIWRPLPSESGAIAHAAFTAQARRNAAHSEKNGLLVRELGSANGSPFAVCEYLEGRTLAQRLANGESFDTARLVALGKLALDDRRRRIRANQPGAVLDPRDILIGPDGATTFFGVRDLAPTLDRMSEDSRARAGWLKRSERERRDLEASAVSEIVTLLVRASGADLERMPAWLGTLFSATCGTERTISTLDTLEQALDRAAERIEPERSPRAASTHDRDSTTDDSASSSLSDDVPSFPYRPLERRYRLIGESHRGGMSELWKAVDLENDRFVAVKRLRPHRLGNPRAERRFRREARSLAALDHPHILKLIDIGQDADGDYMVCEWAERGSLYDAMSARGPLSRDEALEILRKIGSALEHAHARGHVHRDVKPHNILLMADGEPKLGDFGLVLRDDEPEEKVPGARPGTPNYMAPEQGARGGDVDPRADLYAFAKTLLYLFTQQKPDPKNLKQVPWEFRGPIARALSDRPEERQDSVRHFQTVIERRRLLRRAVGVLAIAIVPLTAVIGIALRFGRVDEREVDAATQGPALLERESNVDTTESAHADARESSTASNSEPDRSDPLAAARKQLAALRTRIGDPRVALRVLAKDRAEIDADPRTARVFAALEAGKAAQEAAERFVATGERELAAERFAFALTSFGEIESLLSELAAPPALTEPTWQDSQRLAADAAATPYGGIALEVDPSLAPLGCDPATHLLEFAVLASGNVPRRDASGRLVIASDSAIVLVLVPGSDAGIEPFLIGKYEITQAQYSRLTGEEPSALRSDRAPRGVVIDDRHPVESVSASESLQALEKHGLDLPTEAQWEHAYAAPNEHSFWAGDEAASLLGKENLADVAGAGERFGSGAPPPPRLIDGFYAHAPVGSLAANAFGLHDMAGNVSEWCRSETGFVARGASFIDAVESAKIDARLEVDPSVHRMTLGIRCVRKLAAH